VVPPDGGTRRRTHIVLGALGAIVAIIVGANVLGDPDEPRRTAPATSTSAAPASTTASTASTPVFSDPSSTGQGPAGTAEAAPFIVADPPAGFVVEQAERYDGGSTPTIGQLWTTWAADPLAATWVAIAAWPAEQDWGVTGTSRVWLSDGVGVLTRADDGTTVLDGGRDGHHISIRANGLTPPALAAVMDSLHVDDDHIAPSPALAGLGLRLLVDVAGETAGTPVPRTTSNISFAAEDGSGTSIYVVVDPPLSTFERAMRGFMLRDPTTTIVGPGHLATIGRDTRYGDPEQLLAIVDVDGTEVEVSGAGSERELVAVVGSLRVGTEEDWAALGDQVREVRRESEVMASLSIGNGVMRNGNSWQASVTMGADRPSLAMVTIDPPAGQRDGISVGGGNLLAGADDAIQSLAGSAGVVLVARTGRDHPGAELRVTVADASYHATVADHGATAPGLLVALGFSELAPYHAELVAADGTVLATLDDT
jgi:hypothetical protein